MVLVLIVFVLKGSFYISHFRLKVSQKFLIFKMSAGDRDVCLVLLCWLLALGHREGADGAGCCARGQIVSRA